MTDRSRITVPRTGRRPLRFLGERVAHADTSHDGTNHADRWTEATVYRRPKRWTDDRPCWEETAGYVLAISHMTRWDGETDRHDAILCDTADELAGAIEAELPDAVADELLKQLGIVEDLGDGGRPI